MCIRDRHITLEVAKWDFKLNLANKGGKMTSKDLSIFNSLRPFSIGFDDMFDQFENMLGNGNLTMQSNYPPYNHPKDR